MHKHLLDILSRFSSRKILVVGDLIADEFLYGRIARVSREAPVLVLEYRDLIRMPGARQMPPITCWIWVAGSRLPEP